jgi:subtilisin family serine protease
MKITPHIKFTLVLLWFVTALLAQEKLAPGVYMVRFTDKNQRNFDLLHPEKFLSQRAMQRRQQQNLLLNENDLPVSQLYIDSLKHLGFEVLNSSKWLNALTVNVSDTSSFSKLRALSFVKPLPRKNALKSLIISHKTLDFLTDSVPYDPIQYYGSSFGQIEIHHGNFLHERGFRGKGMLIALIDAGFNNAKSMSGLDSLWFENRVILTRDLVQPGGDVFKQASHGSNVLSIIASIAPGYLVGTAPKASFLLLRTENAISEYPIEEFNWAVGAELSDSIGADIISTSLGYTTFNDPSLNHTYADMNGHTAISSIAATIASSKGMIVVASAGNEGDSFWKFISAPADADSIITVGAIDVNGNIAKFSSRGPSYDKRIKPDVVAVGFKTTVQNPDNSFALGSGTSFSAPVIAGLTACLWQACPGKSNMEIIRAIQQYSSQYTTPDSIKGYGIPDFKSALYALNTAQQPLNHTLILFPNPFTTQFSIDFDPIPEGTVIVRIFDVAGRRVLEIQKKVYPNISNTIKFNQLASFPKGLYIVKILSDSKVLDGKILKL